MRDVAAEQPDVRVLFVELRGDVDVASVKPLFGVLPGSNDVAVVLDMEHVTLMDSSGVNELLALARRGPVGVVAPSPSVRRVMEITGVDGLVRVYSTVDEAFNDLT